MALDYFEDTVGNEMAHIFGVCDNVQDELDLINYGDFDYGGDDDGYVDM